MTSRFIERRTPQPEQPTTVYPFRVAGGAELVIRGADHDPAVTVELYENHGISAHVQIPRATALLIAQAIIATATAGSDDPRSGLIEWAVPQDDLDPPTLEFHTHRQPAARDAAEHGAPLYRVMWAPDPITTNQPDEH
jgi:hypothetical protein